MVTFLMETHTHKIYTIDWTKPLKEIFKNRANNFIVYFKYSVKLILPSCIFYACLVIVPAVNILSQSCVT